MTGIKPPWNAKDQNDPIMNKQK